MKYILTFIITLMTFPAMAQEDTPLQIREITKGVYLHTSFKNVEGYGQVDSNGLIVVDAGQAYIIDTPWSEDDTEVLLSWIAKNGYDAKASISTHSHADRTAGIELLNSQLIPTYASELTKAFLVRDGKPTPTQTFHGNEFSLENGLIEIYYPGAGHTEDNIVVWLPKSKILFGGCIVRSHEWESLGYVGDASIISWADSIENIKAKYYDIGMVVPGHGTVGRPDILDHTIDLAKSAANKLKPPTAKASSD